MTPAEYEAKTKRLAELKEYIDDLRDLLNVIPCEEEDERTEFEAQLQTLLEAHATLAHELADAHAAEAGDA